MILKKKGKINKSIFSIFDYTIFAMTAIRKKLIEEIKTAPESTVKELYKLHALVKSEKNNNLNWLSLTDTQKNKIETGLQQLKEGKGVSAKKATIQLAKKYGLS